MNFQPARKLIASPFQPSTKPVPFTARSLIDQTRAAFSTLPDSRKTATSNNLKYAVEDAALSAFSVFFTQSPSFLDYQVRMQKTYGKNNAQSLFGVHQIPSMNQVRNILDPIPPQTVYPVFAEISEGLHQNGYLNPYRRTGNTLLIALDGTDFFASEKLSCPHCTRQTLKNGKTLHRHTAVTPVIVAPEQPQVVPSPPEFVHPQDGQEKQDCELAAAKRWLDAWGASYSSWGAMLLGDDLICIVIKTFAKGPSRRVFISCWSANRIPIPRYTTGSPILSIPARCGSWHTNAGTVLTLSPSVIATCTIYHYATAMMP